MAIIVKRPLAEFDLDSIFDFIAEDNVDKAEEVLRLIDNKLSLLADSPKMGRLRQELEPELRSFPIGRYMIFYRPILGGIEVVRVLHSSQDIQSLFLS